MNWLVPLPVALPLLVAAGLVAAAPICHRRIADSIGILTSALVTVVCFYLMHQSAQNTIVYWFGGWAPRGAAAIGISFTIDPLGAGMAGFASLLVTAALIYSWEYFDAVRTYFHALMLIFLAAMNGFSLTGDLFNLFVFFELMSVVAYALTAYKVEETSALEGGINFAVTNSIAGFLVLLGVGTLYGRTGALNMAQAGQTLAHRPADALVFLALTLILSGFFTKAAVAPFHFWLSDAHAVAPTPVCVLFSGVMIELGLYGAFRVYWTVFHPALGAGEGRIQFVMLGVGALTALMGAILCFSQRHLKRLLAFSSISHIGIMLAGCACLDAKGLAGAALYVLGHGFVKGSLFMGAGLLLHRFGSVDQADLFGRGRKFVLLGSAFTIGGLGLAGFPPFGTYLGKQMIEDAAAGFGQHWLSWLFLLCSALTGGAVLRVTAMVFLGWGTTTGEEEQSPSSSREESETQKGHGTLPLVMLLATLSMVVLPLVSACFGNHLATGIQAASARFVDSNVYAGTVLRGTPTGPTETQEVVHSTARGLLMGFGAAAGAVALALLSLFRNRLPRMSQQAIRITSAPLLRGLRRAHSGHVGDYIVWLVIGVVVLGTGFAIGNVIK